MKTFIIFVLLAMAMNIASASRLLSPRGKELHTPQEQFPQQQQFPQQPPQQFPQQQFPIPYPPQQSQEPSPYQQYPQQQPSGSDVISISGL
uniref:Fast omega-gliadin n=1 Tax=Triticum dicoccoides TaxID=85692 RepID=A0A0E3MTZ3_TRIDC|nr:fast omega-gliadin [Triticum dicoccoides]